MTLSPQSGLAGYNVGYVFFTHAHDLLAEGIDYFERWARQGTSGLEAIPVHHTGIVTTGGMVVEAHIDNGVRARALQEYLDSPDTLILFRRPRGWSPELGARIAQSASNRIGTVYAKSLLVSQLLSNSLVGHWLNKAFRDAPERWASNLLGKRQQLICSGLSSSALDDQPEFHAKVCGGAPINTISPEELFVDEATFEPVGQLAWGGAAS